MTVIKTLWQNRRHFKLQIFGVTVLLVVTIFLINLLTIKTAYDKNVNNYMSSTVQYTSSFTMSLSGTTGTIEKIYVDSTKTRCFILAQLNSTSNIAMDAANYQMLLTNTNSDGIAEGKPKEQLTGEFYMFGSSGRIGLYIKSDIPFENRMKKVSIRSYKQYLGDTSPYYVSTPTDAQYDQCHIFFNPGGTSATTMPFLETHADGTDFSMSEIYRQTDTANAYSDTRAKLTTCINDMLTTVQQVSEYKTRLSSNYDVAVPESPTWFKDEGFDVSKTVDDNGDVIEQHWVYMPATILEGGLDFDWYAGDVDSGYFHLVTDSNDMDLREYLLALSSMPNRIKADQFRVETWYYNDGTEVAFNKSMMTDYEKEVQSVMDNYVSLLNKYLDLKKSYQTDYLPALLKSEFESQTIGQAYTVNRIDNVLLTY